MLSVRTLLPYVYLLWTNTISYDEREHLFATLLLHEIIWKREAANNQIMQGLALLDVLDLVRKYPNQVDLLHPLQQLQAVN